MLVDSRDDDEYTMVFTNELDKITAFETDDKVANTRNYDIVFRESDALSVWVDLADEVDF